MNQALAREIGRIFNPRSVAVVGVSGRSNRLGNLLLYSLIDMGFKGPLYPVGPGGESVMGLTACGNITDIDGPVDLVIISVHPDRVEAVLEDCVRKGARAAVLFSSGFREMGEAGRERERKIVEKARAGGVRIIGPNCMGLYSPAAGLSFFPGMPKDRGSIAFISQSGSLANILGLFSVERSVRYSKMISVGNAADLEVCDFLEYLGQDEETGVIALYLEGLEDGRRFLDLCREITPRKPVVLWKVGNTEGGKKAAGSHTGSLAGAEHIWEGVSRQAGLLRVDNLSELLGYFTALQSALLPGGNRVAILSGPGGPAVSAADACEKAGLKLAVLAAETRMKLAGFVPEFGAGTGNPVDLSLTSSFDLTMYPRATGICGLDPGVDMLLEYIPVMRTEMMEGIIAAAEVTGKPVAVITSPEFSAIETPGGTLFGSLSRDDLKSLLAAMYAAGVSVHADEQEAAKILSGLLRYRRFRERTGSAPSA